ncbi:MAG: TonB-dependent receptor, partial [Cyclobacteriaceae bacterium]|nr:TonB-dependent receptor [Cyclobacteriaceae bacterium]
MNITLPLVAQSPVQDISGRILDDLTNAPLSGANIRLKKTEQLASSDGEGNFLIRDVPTGRHAVVVSFTGYATREAEVFVNASREAIIEVRMIEAPLVLNEISVNNEVYMNSLGATSGKQVTIEQTNRIPANFLDPIRMITTFPGVVATNDQANNLVVRGNSPNTIKYQLEGMDIVNPNHTANAGTLSDNPVQSGGGVNILSAQMLGATSMYNGVLSPDHGNALTIFDMGFREGNHKDFGLTAQASLIGMDVAAEGPAGKGSFLTNYRYSTVGIITSMGVDFGGEKINFQDLAFNLSLPVGKGKGKVKFFGFGGLSSNIFSPPDRPVESDKDWQDITYTGNTGGVGVRYTTSLTERASFSIGSVLSSTHQYREAVSNDSSLIGSFYKNFLFDNTIGSLFSSVRVKTRGKGVLEAGVLIDGTDHYLSVRDDLGGVNNSFFDGSMKGFIGIPYAKYMMSVSDKWVFDAGLRYLYHGPLSSGSVEPTARASYYAPGNHSFYLAWGRQGFTETSLLYISHPNDNLKLTSSHQFTAGHAKTFENEIMMSTEFYYQYIVNAPHVILAGSTVSSVNLMDELVMYPMENGGKALNYGLELNMEKPLTDQHYLMLGGSLYKSSFSDARGNMLDSRFDGRYTVNMTWGMETDWNKKEKVRTFNMNTRMLLLGGFREL